MQISTTDALTTIRLLEYALKLHRQSPLAVSSKTRNRIRLINNHINKLQNKINNDKARHHRPAHQ